MSPRDLAHVPAAPAARAEPDELAAPNTQTVSSVAAAAEATAASAAVDRIAQMVDPPATPPSLSLVTGHTAAVHPAEPDRLVVRGPAGDVQLTVRFTPEGPVLSFAAAAIDLQAKGALTIDCERLDVKAREGMSLRTAGDLTQSAAGTATVEAGRVAVRAHNGELALDATGDVDVHGKRVLLNS